MDNASKERLVRDGFGASSSLAASLRSVWMAFTARRAAGAAVILRDLVPQASVVAARRAVNSAIGAAYHSSVRPLRPHELEKVGEDPRAALASAAGASPEVTGLLNETAVREAVEDALGRPIPDAATGQVALLFPNTAINLSNPSPQTEESIGQVGYANKDIPFFGWSGHLDGMWSGGTPPPQTAEEVDWDEWYSEPGTNVSAAARFASSSVAETGCPLHSARRCGRTRPSGSR